MTPVLLLLPGMLNDERVWADVVAALPPGAAEVRIAALTGSDSVAAMAAAAWATVADLDPVRPLVIAGFSLGGYVALEMLARPRRPVQAAALLSTQARPETPDAAARRRQTLERLATDFAGVVDGIVGFAVQSPDPALRARLRTMMLDVGAEAAQRQMRAIMGRADHRDRLAALDLPVQVLCGRADRITPPAASEELAAALPRAMLQLVDGAGHMLPMEQPAAVAAALARATSNRTPRNLPCPSN